MIVAFIFVCITAIVYFSIKHHIEHHNMNKAIAAYRRKRIKMDYDEEGNYNPYYDSDGLY